jgi:TPR repeat protein
MERIRTMVFNNNNVSKLLFSMFLYLLPFVVAVGFLFSCAFPCGLMAEIPYLQSREIKKERQGMDLFKQKKYDEARPLLEQACAAGGPISCSALAMIYTQGLGGMPAHSSTTGKPFSDAVSIFKGGCEKGRSEACGQLGSAYNSGIGATKDRSMFILYTSKACYLGDDYSCLNVGADYEVPKGTKQGQSRVFEVSSRGCKEKSALGCRVLGSLYHRGVGVARDDSRAKELFSKTCELDPGYNCRKLQEELKSINDGQ